MAVKKAEAPPESWWRWEDETCNESGSVWEEEKVACADGRSAVVMAVACWTES